ncbi:UNVERIFIED_CONTAM: TonB-dependent receptor plug domain-containing protein, partial [Bacteroidetes bacterium 56_B9]
SPDANPLSTSQVSLRGVATLNSGTFPLVIIDGVQGDLNSVSPNDIAQIDILKDGSAAAIYGTRGTNGVILITTKSGKTEMKPSIEVNSYI